MQGITPNEIFGVPFMLAALIIFFWVLMCWLFLGKGRLSCVLSIVLCLFTFWFYGSRGFMILPVPLLLGIILLCAIAFANQRHASYFPHPRPHPHFFNMRLYHGSTIENVTEIFRTRLFLVGESKPPAFWMADTPQKTRSYCGGNGGILVIDVVPGAPLTNRGGGVYIYEIKGAEPYKEYYQIPHLRPVKVLDPTGTRKIM